MPLASEKLERVLIGSVLYDLSLWETVGHVPYKCFSISRMRKLWRLIGEYSKGDDSPADLTLFYEWLSERGQHTGPGGMANLCELVEEAPTNKPEIVGRYAKRLMDLARRRRAVALANRIAAHLTAGEESGYLVDKLVSAVKTIEKKC